MDHGLVSFQVPDDHSDNESDYEQDENQRQEVSIREDFLLIQEWQISYHLQICQEMQDLLQNINDTDDDDSSHSHEDEATSLAGEMTFNREINEKKYWVCLSLLKFDLSGWRTWKIERSTEWLIEVTSRLIDWLSIWILKNNCSLSTRSFIFAGFGTLLLVSLFLSSLYLILILFLQKIINNQLIQSIELSNCSSGTLTSAKAVGSLVVLLLCILLEDMGRTLNHIFFHAWSSFDWETEEFFCHNILLDCSAQLKNATSTPFASHHRRHETLLPQSTLSESSELNRRGRGDLNENRNHFLGKLDVVPENEPTLRSAGDRPGQENQYGFSHTRTTPMSLSYERLKDLEKSSTQPVTMSNGKKSPSDSRTNGSTFRSPIDVGHLLKQGDLAHFAIFISFDCNLQLENKSKMQKEEKHYTVFVIFQFVDK
jgi:hypothetical protein